MTVELFTAEFHGVGDDAFSNLGGSVGAVTARSSDGHGVFLLALRGPDRAWLATMNCRSLLLLIPVTMFALTARSAGPEDAISQEELVHRTQELFDSVAPGNPESWKKYADDCIFFDEKGRNMTKTALVADIAPLPTGYSGSIQIKKAQSVIQSDTAILSYDLDETETIFGQNLTARYHQTDTWLRRNGTWQIAASQAFRYYEDPAVGKGDPKKFVDVVGIYEMAPGQTRTVSIDGGNLFLERKGKREQLLPEVSEIFFRKGVEGRILFRHAESGKVDALIDRRNNEDLVWRKTSN